MRLDVNTLLPGFPPACLSTCVLLLCVFASDLPDELLLVEALTALTGTPFTNERVET